MKVTIVGAGAIGGLMGAAMIKGGVDVTFVENDKDRVNAMNTKGLTVHTLGGDFNVPTKAIEPSQYSQIAPLGLVYLATKSQHTEDAINTMKPFLEDDSVVVSLQNGFNEELIGRMIGAKRTVGAFVNYGGVSVDPGELEKTNEGFLYIGELSGAISPRLRVIHSQCSNYCPTYMTSNIWGYLWSKEVKASSFIYTALADVTLHEAWDTEESIRVGAVLVGEGCDVADVAGIKLENYSSFDPNMFRPKTSEETAALIAAWQANERRMADLAALRPPTTTYKFQRKASGIWWDIMYRKRKSEADWLAGALIKKGEALGVDVSLTIAMLTMINEIEEGKRPMSRDNFKEMYQKTKELGKDLP